MAGKVLPPAELAKRDDSTEPHRVRLGYAFSLLYSVAMDMNFLLSVSAVAALVPAAILPWRGVGERNVVFWLLLLVALAGALSWAFVAFAPGWRTGFAPALWITICATLAVFALIAAITRDGYRLSAALMPYLIVLGVLATIWQNAPGQPLRGDAPVGWLDAHIAFSLATYAILTLAALAGFSAFAQERALKIKHQGWLTRVLPGLSSAESLEAMLLSIGTLVLAVGVVTGMTVDYLANGTLFHVSHKTLFALLAFFVVLALLGARRMTGLRGRQAARLVMLAYLLLTLGYPGVKFVTDILMG